MQALPFAQPTLVVEDSVANTTFYTWEEIRKHNKDSDCWVVWYGNVLNMTEFLNRHPGGLDPINDLGGYDITKQFEAIGHSEKAKATARKFIIGKLDPNSKPPVVVRKQLAKSDVPITEFRTNQSGLLAYLAPYIAVALAVLLALYFITG
eukprot:GDKK01070764.1.p1 GENE.GDKK01070764.1~~GDKK01070764.1.p1  ORF type:complete len:150 (+),score=17.43 GDKK01070764.1:48-497(+)